MTQLNLETEKNKDKSLKWGIYILIIGAGIVMVAPYIFTRDFGLLSFTNTGTIGDTIGGITAPITSLIGAALVFLALRAQVNANEIILRQIKNQKIEENIRFERDHVVRLINILNNGVDKIEYIRTINYREGTFIHMKGTNAIMGFFRFETLIDDSHGNSELLKDPFCIELFSIISLYNDILFILKESQILKAEKEFLFATIYHSFQYKLYIPIEKVKDEGMKCNHQDCNIDHFSIPIDIYKAVIELRDCFDRTNNIIFGE